MKRLYYCYLLMILLLAGCGGEDNPLTTPSSVSNLNVRADTGAVILTWNMPTDGSFLFLDVSYNKYPNQANTDSIIHIRVGRYADSLVIDGLLNKYAYTFKIQSFNAKQGGEKVGGQVLESDKIRPIRRSVKTAYYPEMLTKVENITAEMLDTYTQEQSEGPKKNLLDGDINTYWHSAWSSGVEPLPHWVEFNFNEPKSVGAFKYNLRQTSSSAGFPTQFAFAVSEDGTNWEQVWTSDSDLPYSPVDAQFTLSFDKNYTAKHFRVIILANAGGTRYTHLSELSLYKMKMEEVDLEKQAEENY